PATPRSITTSAGAWPNSGIKKAATLRSITSKRRISKATKKNYRELAARKVDVFLAVGNERALRAALSAAGGRPIVVLAIDFDPLVKGYVAHLARPGGNVTGIFVRQLELAAKRVEVAREAFPRATVLGIAYDTISREQRDAAAEAARKLGLEPRMIEVKGEH